MITFPCINADRGCTYQLPLKDKQWHELECKFRAFECEGKSYCGWNCNWIGDYEEILGHFKDIHRCGMEYKCEGALMINFRKNTVSLEPIDYFNGYCLFWYKHKVDVQREMVYWLIQFVGLQKHAQQYYYEFEIYDGPIRKLKMTEFCHGHVKNANLLFHSENCVALSFRKIIKFVNPKGYLTFRFRIMRLKKEIVGSKTAQEPISLYNPILFKENSGNSKQFQKSTNTHLASRVSGEVKIASIDSHCTNSETWSFTDFVILLVCFLIVNTMPILNIK